MSTKPQTIRRRSYRLVIEALENRTLLSAYTVDSLADNGQGSGLTGDLRYCITKATSGQDTISFSVTGTIDLSRPLPDLSANLTITGPGANSLTVERNSTGDFRIFNIAAGATVQISGLTITKGSEDQGAGIFNKGKLTVSDSVVKNNATLSTGSNDQGGGIYNSGTLTVSGTTFSGNSASGSGSDQGGGIYNSGTLTVSGTTFSGNSCLSRFGSGAGGAIYNHGTSTFTNSIFTGNSAGVDGGAIFSDKGLSVSNSQFNDNSGLRADPYGGNAGGAIYVGGTLVLRDSSLTGNSASRGGGLYVEGSSNADIGTSTFLDNTGGGILSYFGGVTVAGSTISKNAGAGITNTAGTLTIRDSTLSDNATSGSGGGINNTGTLTITDSTVSGNSAQDGGAIYNRTNIYTSLRPVSVTRCTIAFNSATGNGGGIDLETTAELRNTIIAGNKGSKGADLFGTFSSQGHNLIQNPGQGNGFDSTDLLSIDPLLVPLQDNGGLTFTHALLPGSPAIDAGDNANAPATDQRGLGFARIVNGTIDIGAFEVQNTGPAVTHLMLSAPPTVTAGVPFTVTVSALDADGNPVSGYTGTVTFTSTDSHPGMLPSDYTFTAGDSGKHDFSGVILFTPGTQTLTVHDKANSSLTSSATVNVDVAAANHFAVTPPPTAVAGVSFDVTVAALDPSDNVNPGYRGTVILTSTDRYPQPSVYTFTQGDNGTHVFHVSLLTAGVQTLMARDAANGAITGTAPIPVHAAAADHFLVTAPPSAISGTPLDVIVTALDPYGNTDTNYHGVVTFTTSDTAPGVVLPSPYTFTTGTGGDNGVHALPGGVTLFTPGDQTLTVTDTASGITGSATVTVGSGAAAPRGGGRGSRPSKPITTIVRTVPPGSEVAVMDRFFALLNQEGNAVLYTPFQREGG